MFPHPCLGNVSIFDFIFGTCVMNEISPEITRVGDTIVPPQIRVSDLISYTATCHGESRSNGSSPSAGVLACSPQSVISVA